VSVNDVIFEFVMTLLHFGWILKKQLLFLIVMDALNDLSMYHVDGFNCVRLSAVPLTTAERVSFSSLSSNDRSAVTLQSCREQN